MTQTNDSELFKVKQEAMKLSTDSANLFTDALETVLVFDLLDKAFTLGEANGIAKAEKEFLVFLEPFLKPCNTLEELETFNENVEKMTAKLKNL